MIGKESKCRQTDTRRLVRVFIIVHLIWYYGSYSAHASDTGYDTIVRTSNESVSWQKATESSDALLSYDVIQKYGWDVIIRDIPENQKFWIAARAQHSAFVSWEGCVDWVGGHDCGTALTGGSIADCLHHCNHTDHYILLQGLDCRCIPKERGESCFTTSNNHSSPNESCNTQCLKNPNDRCGGRNSSMSLYFTGPFGRNMLDNKHDHKHCGVLKNVTGSKKYINVTEKVYFQNENCGPKVRRFFCSDNDDATDDPDFVSWFDAFERCNDLGLHLKYNISVKWITHSVYWTSIKRSVLLRWTNVTDSDFPYCVSVHTDDNGGLIVEDTSCGAKYSYLYIKKDIFLYEISALSEKKCDDCYWWFILPIFALITAFLVIFLRRKKASVRNILRENSWKPRFQRADNHVYVEGFQLNVPGSERNVQRRSSKLRYLPFSFLTNAVSDNIDKDSTELFSTDPSGLYALAKF